MDNSQCPHHLVTLAEQILEAHREASAIYNKNDHFREGYFAHSLTIILRNFYTANDPTILDR